MIGFSLRADVMANRQAKMTYNHRIRDRHFGGDGLFHFKDEQWTSNSPNRSGEW
jgi:hypothetical protein